MSKEERDQIKKSLENLSEALVNWQTTSRAVQEALSAAEVLEIGMPLVAQAASEAASAAVTATFVNLQTKGCINHMEKREQPQIIQPNGKGIIKP